MDDLISRQVAIGAVLNIGHIAKLTDGDAVIRMSAVNYVLRNLPSAEPVTAKRIVGKSRDGMTLWYQCDMCNEPVDVQDSFCRGCGRRLIDERSD